MRTIWIQVSSWYGDLIVVIARMLLKKLLNMPAFIDRGFFCFLHIPVLLTSFSIFFLGLLQIFHCRFTVKDAWLIQKNCKARHTECKTVCWSMCYLSSLHYNTFKTTHSKLYRSVYEWDFWVIFIFIYNL